MQALAGTALALLGPSMESQGGSYFLSTGDGSGYMPSVLQLRCWEGLIYGCCPLSWSSFQAQGLEGGGPQQLDKHQNFQPGAAARAGRGWDMGWVAGGWRALDALSRLCPGART